MLYVFSAVQYIIIVVYINVADKNNKYIVNFLFMSVMYVNLIKNRYFTMQRTNYYNILFLCLNLFLFVCICVLNKDVSVDHV